jgi:hypothetical protein
MLYLPNRIYHKIRKRYGPRRFRAFGVGPGKTGTHSLANIFGNYYRSAHEADAKQAIDLLVRLRTGQANESDLVDFVRDRDRRLQLEMDSANFNPFFTRTLAKEFPESKFIVTVRDCFSWVNSAMNQLLNNPSTSPHWIMWRDTIFGQLEDCVYTEQESILRDNLIWNLDSLFSAWAEHYKIVLESVPGEKILLVKTSELQKSGDKIAEFVGVSPETLDLSDACAYRTPKNFDLLAKIDQDFVNSLAQQHCDSLMKRFYPKSTCELGAFRR